MPVQRRKVQSAYISAVAQEALRKEAINRNMFTTTLVSEILEKKAKDLIRKELKRAKDFPVQTKRRTRDAV